MVISFIYLFLVVVLTEISGDEHNTKSVLLRYLGY